MLFIHFFEGHGPARLQVATSLYDSLRRDDVLLASCLSIGELFAGAATLEDGMRERALRSKVEELRLELLPFDRGAIDIFAELRSAHKVKAPDAINLACAGSAGVDLFLTYDKALLKLHVPGIKFIATADSGIV